MSAPDRPSPEVVAACRAIGRACRTAAPEDWRRAHHALCVLGGYERAMVASVALMSLEPEDRERVAMDALARVSQGSPVPRLMPETIEADAAGWASAATTAERRSYVKAILAEMSQRDRRAVAEHLAARIDARSRP